MRRLTAWAALLTLALFTACEDERPVIPPTNDDPDLVNKYAGTYEGLFQIKKNGVDEEGVFKWDSSYAYTVTVLDAGNDLVTIVKGPLSLNDIWVDSLGYFTAASGSYKLEGRFVSDSLYINHKSLSGSHTPPYWFVITDISFSGRKLY
ncbi:MAG: hypothetical protein NZM08_09765 [Chitinophagales bacterium]|nr:hypothetical protein [Chitinophagales bacterium]